MPFRLSLILLGLSLSLAGCDRAAEADAQQQESSAPTKSVLNGEIDREFAGTEMPQVTLTHTDGRTLDLAQLKGEPVLLNLWATWCAPCVEEMPLLDNLVAEMGDDVQIITASQDLTGAKTVTPFFARFKFEQLEPWLDTENAIDRALENGGVLPMTVLYGADGKELFRVAGGYEWDSEEAQAQIKEALAE